jgi:hypothetical protein
MYPKNPNITKNKQTFLLLRGIEDFASVQTKCCLLPVLSRGKYLYFHQNSINESLERNDSLNVVCLRWKISPLPDGWIFDQVTQKRPQKIAYDRKKLEAVKLQNLPKKWQKRGRKIFLQLFNHLKFFAISYIFKDCLLLENVLEKLFYTAEFFQFSSYFGRTA